MDLSNYITKTVSFKFRGRDFIFALSQGLFSSADIDSGTRLLLKVFSRLLDEDAAAGKPSPRLALDAGCGCGVIGICTAAVLAMDSEAEAEIGSIAVRAQDRDELARLVTAHNAAINNIPLSVMEAHTEPLLAGPENSRWDLIMSNIPAKAGRPVLEDFVRRSAALLNPGGRVIIVAVHALADFFREQIKLTGAELVLEEKGSEHSVFVYGGKLPDSISGPSPIKAGNGFLERYPFYARTSADCPPSSGSKSGNALIETLHGAPGFDDSGGAITAAVKLIRRTGISHNVKNPDGAAPDTAFLIHEPGQGFFSCWLLEFLRGNNQLPPALVFSGRNILALEASRHNTEKALNAPAAAAAENRTRLAVVPAADLKLGAEKLLNTVSELSPGRRFGFIAAFPDIISQSMLPKEADQLLSLWESLPPLLEKGGVFIAGFSSSNAERFDRIKPPGFSRLGDMKRKGFRALGYIFMGNNKSLNNFHKKM